MSAPILVTGASGKTGRHVLAGLRAAGVRTRTATRAVSLPGADEHVPFDWADPATHAPAVTGVERVYLVAPVGVLDPLAQIERFLGTARDAGVRRVVFLSHDVMPPEAPGLDAARLAIRAMPEWAALRPSWFMQNLLAPGHHMATALRHGELVSATAGRGIGLVDAADIAAVGVRALLDAPPGREYVITGPEVLGYDEVAATLTELTGRPVRHVRLSAEELAGRIVAAGGSAELGRLLAAAELLVADGAEERITPTVAAVTGRAPRSLRDFLRANAEHLAGISQATSRVAGTSGRPGVARSSTGARRDR